MKYVYRPNHPKANSNGMVRADIAPARTQGPYVISDTMPALKHMGTGNIIDSKARFRAETKASGCVELGNEPIKPRKPIRLDKRQRRDEIRRVVWNLQNNQR